MLVRLHSQATPTPKIRAAIQARNEPAKNTGDDEPDEEYVISDNNILMSNRAL